MILKDKDLEMKAYYKKRAPIYDKVYHYPERQSDLRFLEQHIPKSFRGKCVLEAAAGTGYWTQFIALEAKAVTATDATAEALEQIKNRPNTHSVSTIVWDAYKLDKLTGSYNALFAGLWVSHVPMQELRRFIEVAISNLPVGSPIVFIDNGKVQCKRLPITHKDEFGNTYQDRMLDDGTVYRVLKNFPSETQLKNAVEGLGHRHKFIELENYWLFQFESN